MFLKYSLHISLITEEIQLQNQSISRQPNRVKKGSPVENEDFFGLKRNCDECKCWQKLKNIYILMYEKQRFAQNKET